MEQALSLLPLFVVEQCCSQGIKNYCHRLQSDARFCLEIFRRALIVGDNDAWAALQKQFSANVLYWFRRHAKRREALEKEPEQNFVDDSFARLWQWGHNQKTKFDHLAWLNSQTGFDSLPGILRFLSGCLHSLIVDKLRRHLHQTIFM